LIHPESCTVDTHLDASEEYQEEEPEYEEEKEIVFERT